MMSSVPTSGIPDHIPAELVRDFALGRYAPTDRDPFDGLIPEIHRGPEFFYAPRSALPDANAWVFRRAPDIEALFLDEEHFSSSGAYKASAILGETWDLIPIEIDRPAHNWYRSLLNPLFSPTRMAALEQRVRQLAAVFIDRIADQGACNFMRDFATPYPIAVFLELFGLPLEEMDRYVHLEHMAVHGSGLPQLFQAHSAIRELLREALADRARNPKDDVLTALVHNELQGRRMTESEAVRTALTLFQAGLDTVTTSLGWHFKHLATVQANQQLLRDRPELIPQAVEELMRAFAPVTVPRVCIKDLSTRFGVTIKAGEIVLLSTSVACRDPEAYADPNEIRFDRESRHTAFALGRHRCLGSHLARRELAIGLAEFLQRIPTFRRASDGHLPMYFGNIVGLESLPLTWS